VTSGKFAAEKRPPLAVYMPPALRGKFECAGASDLLDFTDATSNANCAPPDCANDGAIAAPPKARLHMSTAFNFINIETNDPAERFVSARRGRHARQRLILQSCKEPLMRRLGSADLE
jgi:hypothetical protein